MRISAGVSSRCQLGRSGFQQAHPGILGCSLVKGDGLPAPGQPSAMGDQRIREVGLRGLEGCMG